MNVNKSLFELTTEAIAIDELLEQMGGEIPDEEIEAAIDQMLAEHTNDLNAKIDGYVELINKYDWYADVRRSEAERYEELTRDAERKSDKLRERLKHFFERTGREKPIETARHKVSLVNNGGRLPLVIRCDPAELPEPFRRTVSTYKANQEAIRAALEAGEKLPFAQFGERGKSLRIK